ncbi:MAG: hypothetical protein ACRBCJ_11360 [Hyphomicrobiaceae bacterium]
MATTRDTSHSFNDGDPILPGMDIHHDAHDWGEPEPEPRDWKKFFLVAGLGALSWVATYVGMLELIQANMGDLPLLTKAIIGFSVAMLMTMIIWLLDQMFSPLNPATKFAYGLGYIFLTMISVGFGFGFYWKVLESRSESTRSAESAISEVQNSLHAASTRLEQLNTTLVNLSAVSVEKAELERSKGKSCPNSRPGDGPRRKLRDADASQFKFASEFVGTRIGSVKTDISSLDTDLQKIVTRDQSTVDAKSGTRNDFLRGLNRRLDMTVTGFNAFRTDPQLRQIRANLADRSEKTVFPNGRGGTFSCPDSQLQAALRGVVRAIDQLPELNKPKIAAVEGSEATIEAFRRLTATLIGAITLELPPSAQDLRTLQKKAVQSVRTNARATTKASSEPVTGLAKRDYVPLAIAIFVDLCLLLVSMGRPMNRFMATKRKMMEAEVGPVFPILYRFNAIHKQDEMRETFSIFREVIFDSGGVYHVAVPLNAPHGAENREHLLQEAQTLANLCYALEGQGVLVRPWRFTPALMAERKLRRQGSKFVECYPPASLFDRFDSERERPAFRIYAFKNGAWPEMILGAVMGAARRMETKDAQQAQIDNIERLQQLAEAQSAANTTKSDAINTTLSVDGGLPEADQIVADDKTEDLGQTQGENFERAEATEFESAPIVEVEPEVKTAYGTYAARAQREITEGRFRDSIPSLRDEDPDEVTRRRRRRLRATPGGAALADAFEVGETTTAPQGQTDPHSALETEPLFGEVVTFPQAGRPSAHQPEAGDVTATVATQATEEGSQFVESATPLAETDENQTDVTFVRETATFTVPTSLAALPTSLLEGQFHTLDGTENNLGSEQKIVAPPPLPPEFSPVAPMITAQTNTVKQQTEAKSTVTPPPIDPTLFDDDDTIDVGKISERFAPPAAE